MTSADWHTEYPALVRILRDRLGGKETCSDLIDGYEAIMDSVWNFMARLLGDGGTRAVVARSVHLAASDAPLLHWVRIRDGVVDFGEFRDHVPESCSPLEVLDAFLRLSAMIFQTLSELAGDAVAGPLLSHLEEKPRD